MIDEWTFGIITDGKEPQKTWKEVNSIHALAIPKYEIIIAGYLNPIWEDLQYIPMPNEAGEGNLGAMRNAICRVAKYENLCIADDDLIFNSSWYQGMVKYGEFEVLSCVIHNPDGTRYWDWKAYKDGLNYLIPYDQKSKYLSLTGGLTIMKKSVFDRVQWDDKRGFYQEEDVDFSSKLKQANIRIDFNPYSIVIHDARYTSDGIGVHKVGG